MSADEEVARLRTVIECYAASSAAAAREIAMLKDRLRNVLTDAEREAITGVIAAEHGRGAWAWADILRGLLARHSL